MNYMGPNMKKKERVFDLSMDGQTELSAKGRTENEKCADKTEKKNRLKNNLRGKIEKDTYPLLETPATWIHPSKRKSFSPSSAFSRAIPPS